LDRSRASGGRESSVPHWVYVITWIGESVANALFWQGPVIGAIVFVAMGAFAVPFVRAYWANRRA
jgi:hypothetical protein